MVPAPTVNNEQLLLLQMAKGDANAFRQLYNSYWNRIFALAITYLKSSAQAQDIVQEVFLKVWMKREQLAQVNRFESYLFITARNAIIDAFRKNMRITYAGECRFDQLPDDWLLPDQALTLKQTNALINEAIEQLPPQQKLIFKLSREEGLTHDQIAQRLGIIRETVKNHMVRALNSLRKVITG